MATRQELETYYAATSEWYQKKSTGLDDTATALAYHELNYIATHADTEQQLIQGVEDLKTYYEQYIQSRTVMLRSITEELNKLKGVKP